MFVQENGVVSNVKPGTLVEKHICNGQREFYLVSHDAGQSKSLLPVTRISANFLRVQNPFYLRSTSWPIMRSPTTRSR